VQPAGGRGWGAHARPVRGAGGSRWSCGGQGSLWSIRRSKDRGSSPRPTCVRWCGAAGCTDRRLAEGEDGEKRGGGWAGSANAHTAPRCGARRRRRQCTAHTHFVTQHPLKRHHTGRPPLRRDSWRGSRRS